MIKFPSYPESDKKCVEYATLLSTIHKREFFPIERIEKINNIYAINYAAIDEEDKQFYVLEGWKVIS